MQIEISSPTFYSIKDERRFFQGLTEISAIKNVRGVGKSLVMTINIRYLNKVTTREFIAILWRYDISLAPLAVLAENKKFSWLKDERFYWHKSLFVDVRR